MVIAVLNSRTGGEDQATYWLWAGLPQPLSPRPELSAAPAFLVPPDQRWYDRMAKLLNLRRNLHIPLHIRNKTATL